jgi:hypothetical protein
MFQNGVEASTGILVYQVMVQHTEVMKQLEFYGERSSLPNGAEILAHISEVLRQVKAPMLLVVGGSAVTPGLVVL